MERRSKVTRKPAAAAPFIVSISIRQLRSPNPSKPPSSTVMRTTVRIIFIRSRIGIKPSRTLRSPHCLRLLIVYRKSVPRAAPASLLN